MKTARSIEEQPERKAARGEQKSPANRPPGTPKAKSRDATRIAPWRFQPGQSGNPTGRPKHDVAARIARKIFENNEEGLYKAYGKQALKGNAYAFQVLADRAYGKLKERHEYELTPYRDISEADIHARIREVESRLGYAGTPRLTGGTEAVGERTEPQILPPEES